MPGGHSHILKRAIQCATFLTTAQDTPLCFKGCCSGNKSIPPLLRFSFHLWIFCWTTELKYYHRLFRSVLFFESKKTFFWSATQAERVCLILRRLWWVCGLEQQLCVCCCCSSWCLLSQLKALVSTHHHPCPAAKQYGVAVDQHMLKPYLQLLIISIFYVWSSDMFCSANFWNRLVVLTRSS